MPEVSEKDVYNALLRYKGTWKIDVQDTQISLSLNPIDLHDVDSPDCILWVDIGLRLFGQDLKLRVPIPIEAEKGGIYGGALDDLRKLIERGKYPIELPMLVVAEAGYDTKERTEYYPTKFVVNQVPIRLLKSK